MPDAKPCGFDQCSNLARTGRYCSQHYRHLQRFGEMRPIRRRPAYAETCIVEGCEKLRHRGSMCSMHRSRLERTGDVNLARLPTPRRVTGGGYVMLWAPGHPLSAAGRVYEHRKVLYETIGPGAHACAWCRCPLTWDGRGNSQLLVDHFNDDKQDNDPANLLPACRRCNSARGIFGRQHKNIGIRAEAQALVRRLQGGEPVSIDSASDCDDCARKDRVIDELARALAGRSVLVESVAS